MGMILHWNMWPRKVGVSSYLEAVTIQLEQALSNMI